MLDVDRSVEREQAFFEFYGWAATIRDSAPLKSGLPEHLVSPRTRPDRVYIANTLRYRVMLRPKDVVYVSGHEPCF